MDADYIQMVDSAPQTGILCGSNSGELVCIDVDDEATVMRFVEALPRGFRTTIVMGRPGRAKFFFRLTEGETGKKRKLVANGVNIGDWLANGSQAIVAGDHHETGGAYFISGSPTPPALVTSTTPAAPNAAGGLTKDAKLNKLKLERDGRALVQGKALRQAIEQGATLDALHVRSGDQLVVPSKQHGDMYGPLRFLAVLLSIPVTVYTLTHLK
jgi:hypothetical protein